MRIKVLLAAAVGTLLPGVASSQEESPSMERKIEITRQYVPEVGGARKIDFPPRMQDTITLKPEIRYSITPTPWKSVFGTTPISPVGISTAEYRRPYPVYMLLGGGYPAQSALDLYAAFPSRRDVRAGMYINHYGQWTKLENEAGFLKNAAWTENRIGVYTERDFGRRSLDFDFKGIFNYYVPLDKIQTGCIVPPDMFLLLMDASLKFGDAFTDFSRFNYRFGVDAGTWLGAYCSGFGFRGNAFADFGWKAGKGAILAGLSFDGWTVGKESDWYVSIVPEYRLGMNKWSFSAGLKVYYNAFGLNGFRDGFADKYNKGDHIYVLPKINLSYKVADAFTPYITLDGDVGSGSYPLLSGMNPYSAGSVGRPKSAELRGGIRGDAASALTYEAYAGYMIAELPYFIKVQSEFYPRLTPVNMFYAGVEAGLRLPAGFGVTAGARYNSYNTYGNLWSGGTGSVGVGIPQFTVSAGVSYQYRSRLFASLGVEVLGRREFAAAGAPVTGVPASVNLKADVEYKTGPRFTIFVKGDNLLNQRIYRYLGYPALGANVLAGVRMVF